MSTTEQPDMNETRTSSLRDLLQARIDEARERKQRYLTLAKDAEAEEAAYQRALDAEDKRQPAAVSRPRPARGPLVRRRVRSSADGSTKEFLMDLLSNGNVWSLDQMKERATEKGITVPEDGSLGRMLHGALLGLSQANLVVNLGGGRWRLPKEETPSGGSDGASE